MGERASRYWQRANDYGDDETRDAFSHSKSYHRHFQGYAEQKIPGKSGRRRRIERIYVADYYKYEETDIDWRLKKLAYVALYALMAAAVIVADSRPLAINRIPAVGVAQMLSFLPLIYLFYELILQVSAPRWMTIGERDASAVAFQKAAIFCGGYLAAVAVAMAVGKEMSFGEIERADWAVIGLELAGGGLAIFLYFMEKTRKLERIPNGTPTPGGANEIW